MATRFHQGGQYIYPCQHWKSEITLIHILLRTLASWPIYGLSMVFMAFQLESMAFPTEITPYDPYQLKKLWNFEILGFGLWVWPSKFFFGLWRFFWDLWCLRSPVVCKNHISEQYFMPNSFWCQYSIPVHCGVCQNLKCL